MWSWHIEYQGTVASPSGSFIYAHWPANPISSQIKRVAGKDELHTCLSSHVHFSLSYSSAIPEHIIRLVSALFLYRPRSLQFICTKPVSGNEFFVKRAYRSWLRQPNSWRIPRPSHPLHLQCRGDINSTAISMLRLKAAADLFESFTRGTIYGQTIAR